MSPNSNKIFTQHRIAQIRQRYGAKPAKDRPSIYWLACNPQAAHIVEKLEHWASSISSDALVEKIANRICIPDQSRSAISELALMHHLTLKCLKYEYEHDFDGLTPDFFVKRNASLPDIIIEVFTEHPSKEENHVEIACSDFEGRLRKIPLDFVLNIRLRDPAKFASQNKKMTANAVQQWLETDPDVGEIFEESNLLVTAEDKNRGYDTVVAVTTGPAKFIDPSKPREKIEQKLDRYKRLVRDLDCVFAVAYVPDFLVGTCAEIMADAMIGQGSFLVSINRETSELGSMTSYREKDGLFHKISPEMSAALLSVVLVVDCSNKELAVEEIHNPNAHRPIRPGVLAT